MINMMIYLLKNVILAKLNNQKAIPRVFRSLPQWSFPPRCGHRQHARQEPIVGVGQETTDLRIWQDSYHLVMTNSLPWKITIFNR